MLHLILLGAGAAVVYCLLALVKPSRRCGRCKDTPGRSKRYLGLFGPMGKCRRCYGKRRHHRRGAKHVHRFAFHVVTAIKEGRMERPEEEGTGL